MTPDLNIFKDGRLVNRHSGDLNSNRSQYRRRDYFHNSRVLGVEKIRVQNHELDDCHEGRHFSNDK